jgi:hypothetical protein
MLKYLRIAVTALSLTACVLLVALWVRSCSRNDNLTFAGFANLQTDLLQSNDGAVVVAYYDEPDRPNRFDAYFHIPLVANSSKGCPLVFLTNPGLKCLLTASGRKR